MRRCAARRSASRLSSPGGGSSGAACRRKPIRLSICRRSSASGAPHLPQRRSSAKRWAAGTVAHTVRRQLLQMSLGIDRSYDIPEEPNGRPCATLGIPNASGQIRWIDDDRVVSPGQDCLVRRQRRYADHSGKWSNRRVASLPPGRPAPNRTCAVLPSRSLPLLQRSAPAPVPPRESEEPRRRGAALRSASGELRLDGLEGVLDLFDRVLVVLELAGEVPLV